jgi:CysZ protein
MSRGWSGPVLRGARYPLRGLVFLSRHPRLAGYAVWPCLANALVLVLLVASFLLARHHNLFQLVRPESGWLMSLFYLMALLVAAVLALLVAVAVFTLLTNLLAFPFNEALSEQVDLVLQGVVDMQGFSTRSLMVRAPGLVAPELKRLGLFAALQLILLSVYLVPTVGSLVGPALHLVVGAPVTCLFLAVQYLDLPMRRRRYPLRRKLELVWLRRGELMGFGAAVALLLLLPLLNLFLLPMAVVGGTLLFSELGSFGSECAAAG